MSLGAFAGLLGYTAAGAGLNVLASNAASRREYKYQSRLQEQAARLNYDYGIRGLKESPSAQREGLETAGYNPMLAVQNATTGANSGWTTTGQAQNVDYGDFLSNSIDMQRVSNENAQTDSVVNLNAALARKAASEAAAQEIRNPFIPQQEQSHLNQVSAATQKLIRETAFIDSLEEFRQKELELNEMGIHYDLKGRMYASDKGYQGVVYNAKTNKSIADEHSPSGRSASFENYTKGVQNVLNGVGSIIHGYNETNNYNGSDESETVYYDKNGNVRGSVSHKGSKKGSSNKSRKRR